MTILGPKLLSSDNREGFLGNTIDNIFWQVRAAAAVFIILTKSSPPHASTSPSTHLPFSSDPSQDRNAPWFCFEGNEKHLGMTCVGFFIHVFWGLVKEHLGIVEVVLHISSLEGPK